MLSDTHPEGGAEIMILRTRLGVEAPPHWWTAEASEPTIAARRALHETCVSALKYGTDASAAVPASSGRMRLSARRPHSRERFIDLRVHVP